MVFIGISWCAMAMTMETSSHEEVCSVIHFFYKQNMFPPVKFSANWQNDMTEHLIRKNNAQRWMINHNIWKAVNSTIISNWKWLFVSGCKCNIPIYIVMGFLHLCREGMNASMCYIRKCYSERMNGWTSSAPCSCSPVHYLHVSPAYYHDTIKCWLEDRLSEHITSLMSLKVVSIHYTASNLCKLIRIIKVFTDAYQFLWTHIFMGLRAYYGKRAWKISCFTNFVYWNVPLNNKIIQQIKLHYNIGGYKIIVNKSRLLFFLFPFIPSTWPR